MKGLIIIFLLIICGSSFSQKVLNLEYRSLFGKEKSFQFFNNRKFSYKLKGDLLYKNRVLSNMTDSLLIFTNDEVVKLDNIRRIRIPGANISPYLFGAGILFFLLNTSHNLIVKNDRLIDERAIRVTGIFFATGLVMKYLQDKHVRIKKNTRLYVVNLNFDNLNQKK